MSARIPAFKDGNYIVHTNFLSLIFMLDSKLNKILWSIKYPLGGGEVHDVQVLENGNLLLYNNNRYAVGGHYSSLEEINPQNLKTVWSYKASKEFDFYSGIAGGVQKLEDGSYLFSDTNTESPENFKNSNIKIVDINGKLNKNFLFKLNGASTWIQQVKQVNLSEFLKNNQN